MQSSADEIFIGSHVSRINISVCMLTATVQAGTETEMVTMKQQFINGEKIIVRLEL